MSESRRIRIEVPALTRVEGEGSLKLRIENNQIEQLQLSIFEPPRYFEKFLEGRDYTEVVDVVARICGICPVAYQMSAIQALEDCFDHQPSDWVQQMRRLFYCGEWIQSHALHIHLLALPDYFGCSSATELAKIHPEVVTRGLRLQGIGNQLIALFGGRSVHPVGACVGGFHKAPDQTSVAKLNQQLVEALPEARALTDWCMDLRVPNDSAEFTSVALNHPDEYALYRGRLISDDGLAIAAQEWEQFFREEHMPHSTALWAYYKDRPYLVGPLARVNLNADQLSSSLRTRLNEKGIRFPSKNMFLSLLARAIEIEMVIEQAIELTGGYELPTRSKDPVHPKAGVGFGATEAPRGLLWHRYETDANGQILSARIVPPTSQNQARIEEDLWQSLTAFGIDQDEEAIRLHCEKVIRNYDPCISCATHFLRLELDR